MTTPTALTAEELLRKEMIAEIDARVLPTICPTFGSERPGGPPVETRQGRVHETDYHTLRAEIDLLRTERDTQQQCAQHNHETAVAHWESLRAAEATITALTQERDELRALAEERLARNVAMADIAEQRFQEIKTLQERIGRQRHEIGTSNARAESTEKALAEAREALKECADELESYIERAYEGCKQYPDMVRRYERDIEPVRRARAALSPTAAQVEPSAAHNTLEEV